MTTEHSGSGDIERTLQLLWHPDAASGRGPRRSLSVVEIVDVAIDLADTSGLDAVSIRAVAAELGVGAMTLYRYIPSKAELLDLMLDTVNRPGFDELPPGWRAAMEMVGRDLWRLHTTHRWLPLIDQSRPVLGPNAVHRLDLVIGALADTGLSDTEKISLTITIESLVTSLARTANTIAAAQARTGVSHDAFWQAQETTLVAAMESGRYAHMATLSEDAFAASVEDRFEFGLQAILDGIANRLATRHQ